VIAFAGISSTHELAWIRRWLTTLSPQPRRS